MLESQFEAAIDAKPKSYEKDLKSDEPFIRRMYEDLERRIDEFEQDAIAGNEKTGLKEFLNVSIVMAIITIVVFVI